jgi:DNA-directed RNA polymerase specialized sigma24 family protein
MTRAATRPTYKHTHAQYAMARSSGHRTERATQTAVYCVEGAHVTLAQIAARLGLHIDTARIRLKRERRKDGPVTWAGLATRGETKA